MLSVNSPANWLAGAAAPDDVDLAACYPLYPPPRKAKVANEPIPNQQGDFLRLLRLVDTPPGSSASGSLVYLQSMRDASPRQHIVLAFRREVPIGSIALPRPEGKDVRLKISMLKPQASFPPQAANDRDWIEFPQQPAAAWDVIAAPAGAKTRALRLSFSKGALPDKDDLLSAAAGTPAVDDSFELGKKRRRPLARAILAPNRIAGRLSSKASRSCAAGSRICHPAPTVRVNSGQPADDGTWEARRALGPSRPPSRAFTFTSGRRPRKCAAWPSRKSTAGLPRSTFTPARPRDQSTSPRATTGRLWPTTSSRGAITIIRTPTRITTPAIWTATSISATRSKPGRFGCGSSSSGPTAAIDRCTECATIAADRISIRGAVAYTAWPCSAMPAAKCRSTRRSASGWKCSTLPPASCNPKSKSTSPAG